MNPNWKKTFRKTPDSILRKIARIDGDQIVVAAVKAISASELHAGLYRHLEMSYDAEGAQFSERIMPHPRNGKFSTWNAQGREIIRKDLPMVTKTFTLEAPNFGDWSKGSHDVDWDRDVYQRDFIPPTETDMSIALLQTKPGDDPRYIFRFRIERLLDKTSKDFRAELFRTVNLLQENVGAVDVFLSEAETAEYLKTIVVHWDILPPGDRTEILTRVLSRFRAPSEDLRQKLHSRYTLLETLRPVAYISGTSGFQRYFGALLKDDLVVFENLEYGNAIYVMFENWEELSKLSRLDLLRNRLTGFERIVHRAGWERVLVHLIRGRMALEPYSANSQAICRAAP
ncbi:MAG: hypothetical protein HY650_00350 [Acidobacteria bacterium]|nr:hypothetical protein [Acidobacteriota bacterium]